MKKPVQPRADLKAAAEEVTAMLTAAGAVVQRYDASAGCIYLKIDYGVTNSLRIATHPGNAHLNYRYNLIAGMAASFEQTDGHVRKYWPIRDIEPCVQAILAERAEKLAKYGKNYAVFMEQNKVTHKDEKGFWKTAQLVIA